MRLARVMSLMTFVTFTSACMAAPTPKTDDEKAIYALGVFLGNRAMPFELSKDEVEHLKRGFNDSLSGDKTKVLVNLEEYGPKIAALAQVRDAKKATAEKEKSKEFLAKAEKEAGAKKTESGLIYTETQAGTGPSPKATDLVKVHYQGTLIDGTEFDSSIKRGQPAEFPLNQVIKCWTEGVQMMKVGGKAKLVCPSDIAYGDRGQPGSPIGAGATLVFNVELLETKASPAPGKQPAKKTAAKKK
jgi:FKBP-type peptidyl-prolyl cis-trans isomerase FkpA